MTQFWATIGAVVVAVFAILAFIDNRTDALRSEIHSVRADFRVELASVRTELREDVGTVRSEVHTLRDNMRSDFNDVRNRIETLQQTAATTDSRLSRIESDIEALTNSLATAQSDITELQKTNTETIAAISKLDGGLKVINDLGIVYRRMATKFSDTDMVSLSPEQIASYDEIVKRLQEAGVEVEIIRQASMRPDPWTLFGAVSRSHLNSGDAIGYQSFIPVFRFTPLDEHTENKSQLALPPDNPADE